MNQLTFLDIDPKQKTTVLLSLQEEYFLRIQQGKNTMSIAGSSVKTRSMLTYMLLPQ